MEGNIRNLLLGELYSAQAYIERLFHATIDISGLTHHPDMKKISHKLYRDLNQLLTKDLLQAEFVNSTVVLFSPIQIRKKVMSSSKMMEVLLQLDFDQANTVSIVIDYINFIYDHSLALHLFCEENSQLEVQFPRVNLLEMDEGDEDELPFFSLPKEKILSLEKENNKSISSLEWQREIKYEKLIQNGHEEIFNKKYDLALGYFQKAQNYKETAEVFTLIGWALSLLGKNEEAKTYCLRAIKKNPDYGPSYNDLGTYLLAENQVDESLKWFQLAKKAINYQNREYPYINAGRAYIAKNEYAKALEEFRAAITLAPYHEELHETIEKLKKALVRAQVKKEESTILGDSPFESTLENNFTHNSTTTTPPPEPPFLV
jgi:Tfp pilus assembly protein PilF